MLILLSLPAMAQSGGNFCLKNSEHDLFRMINEFRAENNRPPIQISRSLSFTARQHLLDLITNKPDTGNCNMHSWSDKGNWEPCCYSSHNQKCMWQKPSEITSYEGKGYEIIFWENETARPGNVINLWKENSYTRDMLLNTEQWETYTWNAIGVAIMEGFASVWLGESLDTNDLTLCGSGESVRIRMAESTVNPFVIKNPRDRYYLIFGSFNDSSDALESAKKYRKQGFPNASVVIKEGKYRVSLSGYSNRENANKAKFKLPQKFREAWIMKF